MGDSVTPSSSVDVDLGLNSSRDCKVAAAWWSSSGPLPLEEVSWGKYTHMTYAFA